MLELDGTVDQSIQGIIGTDTDIVAGMDLSSTLSNKNVTSDNCLTVCLLYAKTLRLSSSRVSVHLACGLMIYNTPC